MVKVCCGCEFELSGLERGGEIKPFFLKGREGVGDESEARRAEVRSESIVHLHMYSICCFGVCYGFEWRGVGVDGGGEDPYIEGWNKMISRCVYHGSRTLKKKEKKKPRHLWVMSESRKKRRRRQKKTRKPSNGIIDMGGLQTIVQNQPVV